MSRILLALLLLAPAALADEPVVLEVSGSLLVGTASVGVGTVAGAPVSHASHPVSWTSCERHFLLSFAYASRAPAPDERERALMQVELRDGAEVVGAWLATDGTLEAATPEALPPGTYRVHVFHLVGGPVVYRAVGRAYAAGCA